MTDSPVLDPSTLLAQQGWVERLARERGPVESAERRGFLAGVVRNLRRNEARGTRRRTARESAAARPEGLPSAAELVEKAELARFLVESVLTLDEHERTAVLLRYFEDPSAEEIALRSGVPSATARVRLVPDASGSFALSHVPAGRGRIARNDPPVGTGDFAPFETLAEFELLAGSSKTLLLP